MGRYSSRLYFGGTAIKRTIRPAPYLLGSRGLAGLVRSICRFLPAIGSSLVSLDEKTLLKKAFEKTGLDDLGDESFHQAFRILLKSMASDARLNFIGRVCAHSDIFRMLCNRLRLQEIAGVTRRSRTRLSVVRFSSRDSQEPAPPCLHALLAQDVSSRSPRIWEVMHPSPPPEKVSYNHDPRISKTATRLKWLDIVMPGFKRVHLIDARLPQECIAITGHAFISYLFESMYFVDSYRSWHNSQDKRPAYEYHRQFLQHLQCRAPGTHWVLKAPSHLFALETLLQVYPDARIVITHRDPLKVLPSCASFTEVLRGSFIDCLDRKKLGIEIAEHWQKGARLAVEFSQTNGNSQGRFLKCALRRPYERAGWEVVRRIYRYFDMELTGETEMAMMSFLTQNPQNRFGVHRYSLEKFGLGPRHRKAPFRILYEFFRGRAES